MESTGPPTRRPPGLEFAFRLRGHTRGSSSDAVHKLGNPNAYQLTGQNATHQEALTLPPIPGILIFKETAEQPSDYLDEERHECWLPAKLPDIAITWRLKERMKTVSVALVLCLNIGTDPPDVIKISPCARKECWFDPRSLSKAKAIEAIGNNLQAQYERWQARAKYRQALDPTMDDVKKLCASLRRNAKNDRVLFHYNGHGVPRPTSSGEIWVFNKTYTQYIPLSIYDLRAWVGNPSIYVLDCSGAGVLLPHFLQNPLITSRTHHSSSSLGGSGGSDGDSRSGPSPGPSGVPPAIQRDCIVLAPCAANELLPMNPKFPADIFTACLTTPIFVALRWFITQNRLSMGDLDPDFVDQIPGKLQDRKTPLGELNWIFTAITDTIAWNTLPSAVFQRLFRQDQLVASLFRNFLLADRVLRSFNCTPSSIPRLPSTAQHPLWQAWDLAAECCLSQLINERNPSVSGAEARLASAVPAFADQLTAFEVWLDFNSNYEGRPPEQLPVVLQVLLSQAHRLRALQLLRRFLDLGPWAVNLALSVGIFPYVLKLLQSPAVELRQVLVHIWARILGLDPSCRTDLVKDNTYLYFITHLSSNDVPPEQRVMAAFILTVIMDDNRAGQRDCLKKGVHKTCAQFLFHNETQDMPEFRRWLCFCLGKLCAEHQDARHVCLQHDVHGNLLRLVVSSPHAEVRAAAVYALGTLLGSTDPVRAAAGSGGPSGSSAPGSAQSSSSSIASLSMSLEHGVGGAGGPGPQHHQRQWSSPPLSGSVYDSETKRRTDVAMIGMEMLRAFDDASPLVRREAILALYLLITDPMHLPYFAWIAHEMVRFSVEHVRQQQDAGSANRPNRTQPASAAGDGGVPHSAAVKRQATGQHRAASQMQDEQDEQEPSWWGDEDPSQRAAEEMDAGVGHRVNGTATPPASSSSSPSGPEGRRTPRHTAAKTSDWYQALVARLRREGGDIAEQYLHVWLAVRQVHHREPMALIAETAGHIVHVVHEKTLDLTLPEAAIAAPQLSRSTSVQTRVSSATNLSGGGRGPSLGRGSPGPTQTQPVTAASGRAARPAAPLKDVQLPGGVPPPGVTAVPPNDMVPPGAPNGPIHAAQHGSRGAISPHQHPAVVPPGGPRLPPRVPLERPALERTSSAREFRSSSKPPPPGGDDRSSLGSGVAQASAAVDQVVPPQPPLVRHLSLAHKVDAAANHPAGVSTSPAAPESSSLRWLRGQYRDMNLYAWSRRKFSRPDQQGPQAGEEDPLSPEGELLLYRKARNRRALEEAEQLAQKCASILGVPAPDDDSDLLDGLDLLMSIKAPPSAQPANGQQKGPGLKLEQKAILESNAEMTSLLTFHPFENVLVSADEHHSITVWNYEEGKRLGVFSNGNMKPFRLTTLGWLNETSSSLLYTGSDDGVIRVWKGAAETLDSWTPPRLTTAFYAHALVGGGSGLVTKWLPKSGLLVTGGSTDRIRAWDLRREQIVREWNTGGDACVTTMTASCSRPAEMPHRAAPPMPPSSLVVAGMGDGKVKIYDLRMERPVGVQSEHQNWVVLADFVKGDRELITGALTGDIKFWDLRRMNQPLRSVEVGKGPMTAMAVHRTCPIMASGSYNQFIKVLTLEGETLNVIRYHEGILALRIGPVATLAFHPLKLLLAAGATDSNIAIYSPSASLNVNSAHR